MADSVASPTNRFAQRSHAVAAHLFERPCCLRCELIDHRLRRGEKTRAPVPVERVVQQCARAQHIQRKCSMPPRHWCERIVRQSPARIERQSVGEDGFAAQQCVEACEGRQRVHFVRHVDERQQVCFRVNDIRKLIWEFRNSVFAPPPYPAWLIAVLEDRRSSLRNGTGWIALATLGWMSRQAALVRVRARNTVRLRQSISLDINIHRVRQLAKPVRCMA
jgi:hypothetical protein